MNVCSALISTSHTQSMVGSCLFIYYLTCCAGWLQHGQDNTVLVIDAGDTSGYRMLLSIIMAYTSRVCGDHDKYEYIYYIVLTVIGQWI